MEKLRWAEKEWRELDDERAVSPVPPHAASPEDDAPSLSGENIDDSPNRGHPVEMERASVTSLRS